MVLALIDDPAREDGVLQWACRLVDGDSLRLTVLLTPPRLLDGLLWMGGYIPRALRCDAELARRRQVRRSLPVQSLGDDIALLPIPRLPTEDEVDALLAGQDALVLASTMKLRCARVLVAKAPALGIAVRRVNPR